MRWIKKLKKEETIRSLRLVLVFGLVAIIIQLKPPHPSAEAQTSTDTQINNSVKEAPREFPKEEQTLVTQVNEIKQPIQEPVVTTPKPELSKPVSCEVFKPILQKYNWDINVALKVIDAESYAGVDGKCFKNAVGDTRVIGGIYAPSCGLFQIRTLAGRPTCEQLHDIETNVAWAYKLYKGRIDRGQKAWSDWSVCNNRIVYCY